MPPITVIVPTFNEAGNIAALLDRLSLSLSGHQAEVLFVDDSSDETPYVIADQTLRRDIRVRLLHRPPDQRTGGLAGAAADGIQCTHSDVVLVMDGDLQHPPEMAPELVDTLTRTGADLVVASRYVEGGDAAGLSSAFRRRISNGSTMLARLLFPRRVGAVCTDPMTGFFCFRRDAVQLSNLRPRGFKILLEILASHRLRVQELPFVFGVRDHGTSKASWRNGVAFLGQLLMLRTGRVSRFAAIGAIGLAFNLLLMSGALDLGLHYLLAAIIASELSVGSNFLLQERFVFRDLGRGSRRSVRAIQFFLYNNADVAVRLPLITLLVERVHLSALLAQGGTIALSFAARFAFLRRVVYGGTDLQMQPTPQDSTAVQPPSDAEKYAYLRTPQHRWLFWFQTAAFTGVAVSLFGLAQNSYWTLVFLVPLFVGPCPRILDTGWDYAAVGSVAAQWAS